MAIKETSQSSPVFDKNKVRRERVKIRKEILSKDLDETNLLQALYFDGRIDKTYFIETSEDGKNHRRVHKEDHLSIIQEPGSKYVGHVKPLSGKAVDIANSIMQLCRINKLVCRNWFVLDVMDV
uniref:Uncharacterized protein LOC114340002 n=1 Tax=Diabrotica virgifera virgifera TaxID=50390 RepID=A0A6P7GMU2_DIAVI